MSISPLQKFKALYILSLLFFNACSNESTITDYTPWPTPISRTQLSEHTFPNLEKILESPYIIEEMDKAWAKMLSLVKPYVCHQEVGFYIYYNETTDRFWVGELVEGPVVSNNEGAYISLGVADDNKQVCAFFHCHTPWYHFSLPRYTGPSNEDIYFAETQNLPGILYDYEMPDLVYYLPYEILEPRVYTFGPTQREAIYY